MQVYAAAGAAALRLLRRRGLGGTAATPYLQLHGRAVASASPRHPPGSPPVSRPWHGGSAQPGSVGGGKQGDDIGGEPEGVAIHVESPLQDLFTRLSDEQAKNSPSRQAAWPSLPSLSEEALAAARPHAATNASSSRRRGEPPPWSPEHFVAIARAFGQARHYHRIWHKMAAVLVQYPHLLLYRMNPDALTKLACGYAQVKVQETALFREIAYHARRCIRAFSPGQLAQLTWAMSEVYFPGLHGAVEAMSRQAEAIASEFEPRDAVTLLSALTSLRELTLPLAARFASVLSGRLDGLSRQQLLQLSGVLAAVLAKAGSRVTSVTEWDQVSALAAEATPLLAEHAAAAQAGWQRRLERIGDVATAHAAPPCTGGAEAPRVTGVPAPALRRQQQEWRQARQLLQLCGQEADACKIDAALASLDELVGVIDAAVRTCEGGAGTAVPPRAAGAADAATPPRVAGAADARSGHSHSGGLVA